jgi:hypothetical protein
MYGELGYTRAETRRAAALAEAAGFVLDFVKRNPNAEKPRMPNHSEWIGFLQQARKEAA